MDAELALAAFRIFANLSLFRLIRLALEDGVAVPIDNPEANIFELRDKFLLLKATIDSLDFIILELISMSLAFTSVIILLTSKN